MNNSGFTKRLNHASHLHPDSPNGTRGQQSWLRDNLAERGITVTANTLSGWFTGKFTPHPSKMEAIAEILGVDPQWLATGFSTDSRNRNPLIDVRHNAAVLVLAGMLKFEGVSIAFPNVRNGLDAETDTDLYITQNDNLIPIKVVVADRTDDGENVLKPQYFNPIVRTVIVTTPERFGSAPQFFVQTAGFEDATSEAIKITKGDERAVGTILPLTSIDALA